MTYDVVVVGGGIGGLTVAALLSARGINTCLLERQSQVGGCLGRVQFADHQFDPGIGLYSGLSPDGIHRRIFLELSAQVPHASSVDDELVVRLEDATDVRLYRDESKFFAELERAFPECVNGAIEFYKEFYAAGQSWQQNAERTNTRHGFWPKASSLFKRDRIGDTLLLDHLQNTSSRFRSFIEIQLRVITHTPLEAAPFLPASNALLIPRESLYAIAGGPAAIAEQLSQSISRAGGKVRLDTPVLRLAYDNSGRAIGVELLSGETVMAKHAIVSNLTIWDTYGKLIGLNRTPAEVKARLARLHGSGVFVLYASLNESALSRLPSSKILFVPPSSVDGENNALSLNIADNRTHNAPDKKCSVTITAPVDVNDWFRYQSSPEELEEWDQSALEKVWQQLHAAVPELRDDIEVIETSNPRTIYDTTRRKLGMVFGIGRLSPADGIAGFETSQPNVFMIGDTVSPLSTLDSVSQSALLLANKLTALIKNH